MDNSIHDAHATMPIPMGNETVALPSYSVVASGIPAIKPPSDGQVIMFALVSLMVVGSLVILLALMIH